MKKVIYNGVEMSVKQAAIESKVSIRVLYERLKNGLTQETGLFNAVRRHRQSEVCILGGKEITVIEAAKITGISLSTIRRRLKIEFTEETGLFKKTQKTLS